MTKTLASIIVRFRWLRDDLESNDLDDCIYDLIQWGTERGIDLESEKEDLEDAIARARLV